MKFKMFLFALMFTALTPVSAQVEMPAVHVAALGQVNPGALDAIVSAAKSLSSSAESVRRAMESMDETSDGEK